MFKSAVKAYKGQNNYESKSKTMFEFNPDNVNFFAVGLTNMGLFDTNMDPLCEISSLERTENR